MKKDVLKIVEKQLENAETNLHLSKQSYDALTEREKNTIDELSGITPTKDIQEKTEKRDHFIMCVEWVRKI